ncbi:MAG: hypothetical protein IT204_11095 [Fimbriimonadaceae bacterium]|nr:hypothetical protein [Fimbriimonadaceae bacterium]
MPEELLLTVRRALADLLRQPLETVTAATSPANTPAWDSLLHLNLVLALEQRCGVFLTPDALPEAFTAADLATALAARRG